MKANITKLFKNTIVLVILVGTIACEKVVDRLQSETPGSTKTMPVPLSTSQIQTRIATPTPTITKIISTTPTSTSTRAPFVLLPIVPIQQHPLALDTNNVSRMVRLGRFGTGSPNYIAFSPDGKYLTVATGQGVYFYDAITFQQLQFIDLNSNVYQLAFSADGKKLLLASSVRGDSQISLWDVESGQKIIEVSNDGHDRIVHKLAFSNSGYIAATSTEPYWTTLTRVWSATSGRLISESESEFYGHAGDFLGFSLDGNTLYFPGQKNNVLNLVPNEFHDATLSQIPNDLEVISGLPTEDDNNNSLSATSPDGRFKAVLRSSDIEVNVVALQTNQTVVTLSFDSTESLAVGMITINGAETYVAATSDRDGRIVLWDLFREEKIATSEQTYIAYAMAFSPDKHILATESSEGEILLWDIDTMQLTNVYKTDTYNSEIRFSNNGEKIILVSDTGASELDLFDGELVSYPRKSIDSREIGTYDAQSGYYYNVSIAPDSSKYSLNNINTQSSTAFPVVSDDQNSWFLDAIAISPDGKYLVGGLSEAPIAVWDFQTQRLVGLMTGHLRLQTDVQFLYIRQLGFSPWTNLLFSVGYDESTRLWDIQTGKQITLLNVCCEAQFSPDGRILVTAGNGVIRVWGIPPWP